MTRLLERDEAYSRMMDRLAAISDIHREIIDRGRKVLNATSDIGMSQTEFIEWALERLEGK